MPRKITIPESCVDSEAEKKTPCVKHAEPCVKHAIIKPKRQITDAQREHLNKIRELAMQKKKELKEITLKSKLAKTVPRAELAAQYDNYMAQKSKTSVPKPKPRVDPEPESESESDSEVIVKKKGVLLAVNNLRDLEGDRAAGKRTLAARFGLTFARRENAALVLAPFVLGLPWLPLGYLWAFLLPLMTLPLACWLARACLAAHPHRSVNQLLAHAAALHASFGLLLSLALLLP